jgi:hypothetical protein
MKLIGEKGGKKILDNIKACRYYKLYTEEVDKQIRRIRKEQTTVVDMVANGRKMATLVDKHAPRRRIP